MHRDTLKRWQQDHDFLIVHHHGERRTVYVLMLTAVTMVAEIVAGSLFGSMALLADGWHMATHVLAFLIALFAYRFARRHAHDSRFAFGTGKVGVLGGFSSAIFLGVVALLMLIESIQRLLQPQAIQLDAALAVAMLGLIVNLISALLLHGPHRHGQVAGHDHNLKAAYMHVMADALTSLLAIAALLSARFFELYWLDPAMGMVGAAIILVWAGTLLGDTAPILLDGSIDSDYLQAIRERIEGDADNRIADLHVWKISADHYAAIITLVSDRPRPTAHYKALLSDFDRLSHLTIEVHPCSDSRCSGRL